MKIYIDNVEVRGNIMPVNKPTLDETLETFSFALISSENQEPYKPMTSVIFEDDNGVKTPFVITIDSVEVFSSNPVRYKHSLTCVQSTRKLSKALIRNSCFSQPANMRKQSFTAGSLTIKHKISAGDPDVKEWYTIKCPYDYPMGLNISHLQDGSEPLLLSNNEKMLNSYVKIDCIASYYAYETTGSSATTGYLKGTWQKVASFNELQIAFSNVGGTFAIGSTPLIFRYSKSATSETYEQSTVSLSELGITSWDDLEFGKLYDFPRLKELADNGYKKFYFVFPNVATDFLNIGNVSLFKDPTISYNPSFPVFIIFHLRLIGDTYNYSAKDVLNEINGRYVMRYEVEIPSGYTFSGYGSSIAMLNNRRSLWDGYESWTEVYLDDYIPPNMTFTQCTAYECVAEVFRGLDATFTFTDRTVGGSYYPEVLKIEFLNDWSGEHITPRFSGLQLALSEDNYNNGLVSYYQDGRVNVKTSWLPIRSQELGVPQEHDHCIIVPLPIYTPKKLSFVSGKNYVCTSFTKASGSDSPFQIISTNAFEFDITYYLVEESIWTLLDTTNTNEFINPHYLIQANSLSYTQGGNFINLGRTNANWLGQKIYILPKLLRCAMHREVGIWGNTTNSDGYYFGEFAYDEWYNVFFNVDYESTSDGRVVLESLENKYMGESLVDQYNGAIDLNKMGLNMLGLSLKMGQPSLNCNHIISKWSNRIKQGQIYLKDGEFWLANVCSYTILPNGMMQGSISFVKNFNSLSLQTRLSKARRLSNISNSLTTLSEDNLINYVYVDTEQGSTYSKDITTGPTAIFADELGRGIQGTFDNPSVYALNSKHPKQAVIKTNVIDNYVYIPLVKYGLGNSVCFEMAFDHPINAGNQTTYNNTGWFSSTPAYFTRATKYTDDYGYFLTCNIRIGYANTTTQIYPVLEGDFNSLININELSFHKQPNEVFALNYQLCFLPLDIQKDFIMPEFVNKNYFVDPDNHDAFLSYGENTKFRFYYDKDDEGIKYSQLDVKAIKNENEDNYVRIVAVSRVMTTSGQYCGMTTLTFTLSSKIYGTNSWAITDTNGNVYIASNNYMQGNTVIVRFLPLPNRKQ